MKRTVLLLIGLLACSDDSDETAPASTTEPAIVQPDDLLLRIEVGSRALQRLSEKLESPLLRELVPATPSELVRRIDPTPRNVDDGAPVRIALVGDWLEPSVGVGFGSNGLRAAVATAAPLLEESGPWLRQHEERDEIALFFQDEAMAELRAVLESGIAAQVREAREGIRREVARHDEPPAFGDPAALVDWVAERMSSYVAYVSDLRSAVVTIQLDPLEVKGTFQTAEGSPASRAQATEGRSAIPPVPRGAAMAWWRATPRVGWAELFEATAGDRLSDEGRARLAELSGQPADALMVAVGYDDAAYALVRSPHELVDVEGLLNLPYVRTLASTFRCERVNRVRIGQPLCAGAPSVHVWEESDHVLAISGRDSREFLSGTGRRILPTQASGLIWFDAGRVAAASGLWREGRIAAPQREAPLVLHWNALSDQVEVELDFAPGSLSAFADAFMAATDP